MVIDTSAILAILFDEPERGTFGEAIADAGVRLVSAVNAFEASIVLLSRKGPAGVREFDLLLHQATVDVVPFTDSQIPLARTAFGQYGKGRHPAALNFGDCCAYALSRFSGEPLLFKGNDFSQTDIVNAV